MNKIISISEKRVFNLDLNTLTSLLLAAALMSSITAQCCFTIHSPTTLGSTHLA